MDKPNGLSYTSYPAATPAIDDDLRNLSITSCNTDTMSLEKDEDVESSHDDHSSLIRLEIRYLRRDISTLKDDIRHTMELKANRSELSNDRVADHEARMRLVERRINWAWGFGAAAGTVAGFLVKFIIK